LVAHLMFRVAWKQLLYVMAVVVVFMAVNAVRAFFIMFVGSASGMRLLVGHEHLVFGWILFVVAMGLMYWVAERYSDMRGVEAPRGE
jgi:exosortase/archaeosortase family protein